MVCKQLFFALAYALTVKDFFKEPTIILTTKEVEEEFAENVMFPHEAT